MTVNRCIEIFLLFSYLLFPLSKTESITTLKETQWRRKYDICGKHDRVASFYFGIQWICIFKLNHFRITANYFQVELYCRGCCCCFFLPHPSPFQLSQLLHWKRRSRNKRRLNFSETQIFKKLTRVVLEEENIPRIRWVLVMFYCMNLWAEICYSVPVSTFAKLQFKKTVKKENT